MAVRLACFLDILRAHVFAFLLAFYCGAVFAWAVRAGFKVEPDLAIAMNVINTAHISINRRSQATAPRERSLMD